MPRCRRTSRTPLATSSSTKEVAAGEGATEQASTGAAGVSLEMATVAASVATANSGSSTGRSGGGRLFCSRGFPGSGNEGQVGSAAATVSLLGRPGAATCRTKRPVGAGAAGGTGTTLAVASEGAGWDGPGVHFGMGNGASASSSSSAGKGASTEAGLEDGDRRCSTPPATVRSAVSVSKDTGWRHRGEGCTRAASATFPEISGVPCPLGVPAAKGGRPEVLDPDGEATGAEQSWPTNRGKRSSKHSSDPGSPHFSEASKPAASSAACLARSLAARREARSRRNCSHFSLHSWSAHSPRMS
mmetsp:Transcript_78821/g.174491  ORF Transcript_78821/g.174491 Transcript_78821/m.174491 type:complete len:301 (+) Transcript_78821:60-962(+)